MEAVYIGYKCISLERTTEVKANGLDTKKGNKCAVID